MTENRVGGATTTHILLAVSALAIIAAFLALAALSNLQQAVQVAIVACSLALLSGAGAVVFIRQAPGLSLRLEILVYSLSASLATATGAWLIARQVFDLDRRLPAASAVLFLATGSIGIMTTIGLARQVDNATRSLAALVERLPTNDARHGVRTLPDLVRRVKELSTWLEEARARERALEESRRELVAAISHDLRTPLNAMGAILEALQDNLAGDEATVRRYYDTLHKELHHIVVLVDDLFELSRIDAGIQLEVERISLRDLLSDVVAEITSVAAPKGISVHADIQQPLPPMNLSPSHIQRVLANLLDNAVRYSPPGSTILLEAGADEDTVQVAVSDACGGMPGDEMERIFDPAFRGERARAVSTGSGLGLVIARGLVEAHGGSVEVDNEGRGCRFVVRLPVDGPDGPSQPPPPVLP